MTAYDKKLWEQKAELMASALDFRNRAVAALDKLMHDMVKAGAEIGSLTFETENKRLCRIALTVGEEASTALAMGVKDLIQEEPE